MIGRMVSHYRIVEKIGGGGMGVVYKAQDTKLNRFVAVKFLPPELTHDPAARQRFIREAQAASSFDHPNICAIHEINETVEGRTYIVMPCLTGRTLKERIEAGPLGTAEAVDIAIQIARGLKKAHDRGIVHRDIKPANLFLDEDGTVRILDFGLAKLTGSAALTRSGSTTGTPAYMSPEQACGETVDHRTDIWSLGVVLFEMLTGRLPFRGECEQAVIYSILNTEPVKASSISSDCPAGLERIIDRALQKDTSKRYRQVEQMGNDLSRLELSPRSGSSKGQAPSAPARKWIRIAAPIAALVLLGVSSFGIFRPSLFHAGNAKRPVSIAVISFQNRTGNDAYDYLQDAIPNLLITGLEQSPSLRVTTWERLYDLLKQTGNKNPNTIDAETGFSVCSMDGIDAIVLGSYVKVGDNFIMDVKVMDVATHNLLKSVRSQGTGVESILKHQIDELSNEISGSIVLPREPDDRGYAKIADVTTSSLEAYQYYVRGLDEEYRATGEGAKYFKKAVETDTAFATAYLWLGRIHGYVAAERKRYLDRARRFSRKASQKERLYIDAELEPDEEQKIRLIREILRRYPKEKYAHYLLGEYHAFNGDFGSAIAECRKALVLDPAFAPAVCSLCYWYAESGDHRQADDALARFAAIHPGDVLPMATAADIYYIEGKLDEAIGKYKAVLEINPDYGSESIIPFIVALREDYDQAVGWMNRYIDGESPEIPRYGGRAFRGLFHILTGRYRDAGVDLQTAREGFGRFGKPAFQALCDAGLGALYFESQQYDSSEYYYREYNERIGDSAARPVRDFVYFTSEPFLGMIDVRQGEFESARMRLRHQKEVVSTVHVTIRDVVDLQYRLLNAELLMAEDSTDAAIALGESIRELAPPRYFFWPDRISFYNLPLSRDVLARAYLKKGHIEKAIAEYERLIRFNPESRDRRLPHPKYHYNVGKLYCQQGRNSRALKHLNRFLDLWKNADEDLPEPADARKMIAVMVGS